MLFPDYQGLYQYLFCKILGLCFGRGQALCDEAVDDLVDRLAGEVAVGGEGQGGLQAFLLCDSIAVDDKLLNEAEVLKKYELIRYLKRQNFNWDAELEIKWFVSK